MTERGSPLRRALVRKHFAITTAALSTAPSAPPADHPPLGFGQWCRLYSGGPAMLVVDVEPEHVTAAWGPGETDEYRFPRACVRRCAQP